MTKFPLSTIVLLHLFTRPATTTSCPTDIDRTSRSHSSCSLGRIPTPSRPRNTGAIVIIIISATPSLRISLMTVAPPSIMTECTPLVVNVESISLHENFPSEVSMGIWISPDLAESSRHNIHGDLASPSDTRCNNLVKVARHDGSTTTGLGCSSILAGRHSPSSAPTGIRATVNRRQGSFQPFKLGLSVTAVSAPMRIASVERRIRCVMYLVSRPDRAMGFREAGEIFASRLCAHVSIVRGLPSTDCVVKYGLRKA